jgi:O-succinylhomoserine sulfhydrylase
LVSPRLLETSNNFKELINLKAFKFINSLKLFDVSNNLGDTKSLVTHPTTTTHKVLGEKERQSLGITPNLIRLSVGLEDISDLKSDILEALDKS